MTRDEWNSMTHEERVRHYSGILEKLKLVSGVFIAIYSLVVAGISFALAEEAPDLIRGDGEFDRILLVALPIALGVSTWLLLHAWKAFRAFDGLLAELMRGLIPNSLRPSGISRGG